MIKKFLPLTLILLFLFVLAGCSSKSSDGSKSANTGADYTYTIKVTSGGKTVKEYKIEDIKKFQTKSITVDGKTEEGPQLLTILNDAGIKSFSQITLKSITGDTLKLTKDKIDNDTLLDLSNRNTLKLASKIIQKADWTKDITEIMVEE